MPNDEIPSEASFLLSWPDLAKEERPRTLFVDTWLGEEASGLLSKRGWEVVDVRAMPNKTDGDKAECVKAYLEGVRLGTIKADAARLRHMELEAKIYGLVGTKEAAAAQEEDVLEDGDLDSLLSFGTVNWEESLEEPKPKKRGRPKGSTKKAKAKVAAHV